MQPAASSFDHIIKKNFEGDIQFKRVKKGLIFTSWKTFKFFLRNSIAERFESRRI